MIDRLIEKLCKERGEKPPKLVTGKEKDDYFRSLCNTRPPWPISDDFLAQQDLYLKAKLTERGIVNVADFKYENGMTLWQGDITRLNSGAIVNACNSALLGCFSPLHNCIDNVIHTNAGIQVRLDCNEQMQGAHLPNGIVEVTGAYNLPSKYIFHTVGPIIENNRPSKKQEAELAKCYSSSITKAHELGLESLALCCLSTGVYGYPKELAAKVAVNTVRELLPNNDGLKVIFNVFTDEDKFHYENELSR